MAIKELIKLSFIKVILKIFGYNKPEQDIGNSLINKILIIRLDEIGDVVLTSPFIREIKRNYPCAEITLLVKPQVYNLVELCPYINKILIFNYYNGKLMFFINLIKAYRFATKYLVSCQFDLAIIPRCDVDIQGSTFLAYFSRAKFRIAYSEKVSLLKSIMNLGFDKFFTHTIKSITKKHEVERNLDLIRYLHGGVDKEDLEIWISKDDELYIDKIFNEKNCIYIALCPTSGSKHREWDILKYCDVLNLLNKNFYINVVVLGDIKNTFKALQKIKENYTGKIIDLVGKTTLRETAALMKNIDIYLGGDTGPMHIAAACKIDGIVVSCHPKNGDINHGNSPERFGPWKSPLVVIQPKHGLGDCKDGCNKKYSHCINQITVKEVYSELKKLLDKKIQEKSYE